jgi:hypothetical protein
MREHDLIVLQQPLPDYSLHGGAVGTVVHIHADGVAIEAEFLEPDGRTLAVLTLPPSGYRMLDEIRVALTRTQCDLLPG